MESEELPITGLYHIYPIGYNMYQYKDITQTLNKSNMEYHKAQS